MSKFMKIKHNVAQFIDNLGKNTIIVATVENGSIRFEEMRTESPKKEVIEAIKHCPNQCLVAFNGKLVKETKSEQPCEEPIKNTEDLTDECTSTD